MNTTDTAALPPADGDARSAQEARRRVGDLRDFSDKLSPMLVKELRQGLRSRLFVICFLLLHLLLVFITLTSLGADDQEDISLFFWWSVCIGIGTLLPLSGFNALVDERSYNTLDSLLLTRLNAWRIIWGKWSSIAARILLLMLTLAPYLVFRYYAGGVNIMLEVKWMILVAIIALLLTSLTVGFSWIKFFLLRGIFTAAGVAGALGIYGGVNFSLFDSYYPKEILWMVIPGAAYVAAFLIYQFLETGAKAIAPDAENRSTLRRLVTVAYLLLGTVICFWFLQQYISRRGIRQIYWVFFVLIPVAWASTDAACEPAQHVSVICHPFVKKGILGRLTGIFLYPGWHTGSLLLVGCGAFLVLPLLFYSFDRISGTSPAGMDISKCVTMVIFAQILAGVLFTQLFFKNSRMPFVTFWMVQLALVLLAGLFAILAETTNKAWFTLVPVFVPICRLFHAAADHVNDEISLQYGVGMVYLVCYGGILVMLALKEYFTKTLPLEKLAIRDLKPAPTESAPEDKVAPEGS